MGQMCIRHMYRPIALCLFLSLSLYFRTNAAVDQGKVKVTVDANNQSRKEIMRSIEKQTGLTFFYSAYILDERQKVTISMREKPLDDVLEKFLQGTGLIWAYDKKLIFIKEREYDEPPILKTKDGDSSITNYTVQGKVTAPDGSPIPGATVLIKRTQHTAEREGATTDEAGNFSLPKVRRTDVLIVSSVGYQTMEIPGDKPTINIKLGLDIQKLNEVAVVSTGYQNIPKERATGSFAFVDNQLYNRRVSTDVLTKLEGIVPGMIFNRNVNAVNNPNGVDINIRGHSTINSNDQPLIVVDNFPFDGNINNINPNDVESVTILKDAAAASIWGVRSGNGVIVITTKKGRRDQKMQVELNTNLTIGEKPNLFYSRDFLNSNDFINVEQDLFSKGFYDAQIGDPTQTVSPVVQLLADARDGKITQAAAQSQINSLRKNDYRNDLKKYFYQNSVNQQYQINLRGGGNNSDYFFSAGYDKNKSNQKGNNDHRITLNLTNNYYPIKNLSISSAIYYVETSNRFNSTVADVNGGNAKGLYPYARLVDKDGNASPIVKDFNYTWITDTTTQKGLLDWRYFPLNELNLADISSKGNERRINFAINYTFLKLFKLKALYQLQKTTSNGNNYYSDSTYYTRLLFNRFTNLPGSPQYPIPIGGILKQTNTELTSNRGRIQIEYQNNWKNKHEIAGIIAMEISQAVTSSQAGTTYGYDKNTGSYQNVDFVNYYPTLPFGAAQIPSDGGFGKYSDRYLSYISNLAYTFNGKYSLSASGRIDKSNLFGVSTNQKSVPLYSVGVGWEISSEKHYTLNWLPYLKLRATYGYTGNINKTVAAITTIAYATNNFYSNDLFAGIQNNGNPKLRWEKTRIFNIAFDFSVINQALSGSLEFYRKNGIDLFGTSPLPPSTGFVNFYGNTANTIGNGVDVVLNSRNINSKKFKWNTTLIFNYVLDKVSKYEDTTNSATYISLGNNNNGGVIFPLTNRPLFAIYAYPWAGLSHSTGDPQGYINGKPSTDWSTILATTNINNMYYVGPSRPTVYGSLRNTISYKSISFSFNLIYKFNYYFRKSSISYSALFTNWEGHADYTKRWTQPGDEEHTNIPSIQYPPVNSNREIFYRYSTASIDRADHIRLQDISISYDIDKLKLKTGPFSDIQLRFYINNLGILWRANHDHLDPDLYGTSIPTPKAYSIGINANL